MKLALLWTADSMQGLMEVELEHLSGPDWVDENSFLLTHLPENVRENLKTNKSMRQDCANMCSHFAESLRRGVIPTEAGVLDVFRRYQREWPPVTRNFLQRGRTVASVAKIIFEWTTNDDEWTGNGELREVLSEQIDELPMCRNDHEFGFVAGMCGY